MAIKEYRVPQANLRPIYKKPVRLPRDYVQPSKAAAKETPEVPLAKGQAPIAAQGRSPRYDAGSLMGLVSSLRSPGEANPAFDSSKPIGGENVPYKGTSGIGGVFSRIFGNRANELNLEAQQTQAAEMRDKALKEEERQFELDKIEEAAKGPAAIAKARLDFEKDRATQDEIERNNALDLQLVREGEKDILGDVDMARREVRDAEERALRKRELDIKEQALKPPRYSPIGNTGLFQTPEGELGVFEPGMPSFGTMKGTPPRIRMMTGEGSKPPAANQSGSMVDRITGQPVSATPTAPTTAAPKVTAPRSGLMNMIGAGAENVAGALGLDGITEIPAALGDLISRDPRAVEKAARSRARYLNPSMQRTY